MSQLFYKYIAKELIFGYFKKNPLKKGDRYYVIIEQEESRDGLINALSEIGTPIHIDQIYQGGETVVQEDAYDTIKLDFGEENPGLIIGYDQTATEDYLTTLRNAVGEGNIFDNYGILFVLSNSVLSSLITAGQDLQGENGPLHSSVIIDNITQKAEEKITKEYERLYLRTYLQKIAEYIADGTCNLFDFQPALSILQEGSLEGHFASIEYFRDDSIYEPIFKIKDSEMVERISTNQEFFRKVHDIMQLEDDGDQERIKEKMLLRILDEKLTKEILSKEDTWEKDIPVQKVLDSIERKASTAALELKSIELPNGGAFAEYLWVKKGNAKKSSNFIIICDKFDTGAQDIKLTFNKDVKELTENKECQISSTHITMSIADSCVRQSVGKNDNHHDFFIIRLPLDRGFFKDIEHIFNISSKGEIVVNIPDDRDEVCLGSGTTQVALPPLNQIEWNSDFQLVIPIDGDSDENKIQFSINLENREVRFVFKLFQAKPALPLGPEDLVTPIWDEHKTYTGVSGTPMGQAVATPFFKIACNGEENAIISSWRKYLEWEKLFVENRAVYIESEYNNLTGETEFLPKELAIPQSVRTALDAIYAYYGERNTIPSLTGIDDTLRDLLFNYTEAVKLVLSQITTDRCLTPEEYNLTHLGVLKHQDRVYLSPFHPMLAAYMMEFCWRYDSVDKQDNCLKLISPFYLIPYLTFHDVNMRPYADTQVEMLHNWLIYEPVTSKQQERANDITRKMVWQKMDQFISHFKYLFQDKECPIVISTIGVTDDENVIIGIIEYIKKKYDKGVQRIELHEYVDNIMSETYFEKLNRLNTVDSITRELERYGVKIEQNGEYTAQEIIHQLFTKVSLYKHSLSENAGSIDYCHIAFYQMNTGENFVNPSTDDLRVEMSMGGLISIPSTTYTHDSYHIGFGTCGLKQEANGSIYPMAIAMNNLYANEHDGGNSLFHKKSAVIKRYKYAQSELLDSIYENANWVTFLNPEVDINFFYSYNQKKKLYIVHYTDQYTINAKYDSITVTQHVEQYENMLRKSYDTLGLSEEKYAQFNTTMMNYFNCLNGSWMLSIVNKTEAQIREKMSIVASCIAMMKFMSRTENIRWIPISLEEILRVSGSIGLQQDYIFTKKELKVKGSMSDDLLMMGMDATDPEHIKLYFYPVEVKDSVNSSFSDKGTEQVRHTYLQMKVHLFGDDCFTKDVYRTFFASQYLTNAEKLYANNLLPESEYKAIDAFRYELLNLNYEIQSRVPVAEMGHAALVSFFSTAVHSITTSVEDNVSVCEIHFPQSECFKCVAEPDTEHLSFLVDSEIVIDTQHQKSSPIAEDLFEKVNSEETIIPTPVEPEVVIAPTTSEVSVSAVAVASTPLPASTSSLTSGIKIQVGNVHGTSRQIFFEPNNTKMVSHPNLGIIGTMGTGKTQFARSVIAQFSKETAHNVGGKPVGMLVFDYKGDYKDQEFLDAVGGHCYKFNYPFNPLKLVITDDVVGMNLPAITADRISDSFAKAYGLGLKQQSNIKQVILDTYNDMGITKDPSTWGHVAPTMDMVVDKYFETYDANDKAYALFDKLRDYTIFTSDISQCVSLFEWLDSVRVIDLTLYPDDTKKVIVSLILDLFYNEMRQLGGSKQMNGFRELRAMVMVDEAHQFLKKDFASLRSIISEGRMFGVGMILSTQNVSDFHTANEDYSAFILSWVIHHVNNIGRGDIASIFGASDTHAQQYMDFISHAGLFESICKLGNRVEGMRDLPFFELIQQDGRFKTEPQVE